MVTLETMTFPAASMGRENPLPDIKNVSYIHAGYRMTDKIRPEETTYLGKGMIPTMLPYLLQDDYDRERKPRAFQTAVVENSHIRAVFLPELGGRLWSLYDKDQKKELLYVNSVFQPGNLGLRNAWFSGGVEFNVGIKGHNPLTCSPLHVAVDETPHGQVLRLYEYERIRGVVYSVSAWVNETDPVLYLRCRIENASDKTRHMYWWSNIAVPETAGTRVIVPTDDSFLSLYNADHYLLDKASIPFHDGMDVSYPTKIPASRDFFYKIPEERHKWIAAANEEGTGLLQCSTKKLKGRKLFVWGMGQGGRHWNEWLSQKGEAYIEIQAGLAHTQLEHIPMPGNAVWEWTEAYTLLQGDPKILHGEYGNAVRAVEDYMLSRVGDPDTLFFPEDEEVTSSKLVRSASGWGALEEASRGQRISKSLVFPEICDDETAPWWQLLKTGSFPAPNVLTPPKSFQLGEEWVRRLESLPEKNWFSYLQLGTLLYGEYVYGRGDAERVKNAFERSEAECPNPWAKRNLARLYETEQGDTVKAREYLLAALEQRKDFLPLAKEVGMLLTRTGEDALWLEIFDRLSPENRENGRLRLLKGVALIHLDRLEEAREIINEKFVMADVKEGELSVSHFWFELYRRLWAKEQGAAYDPENESLCAAADAAYPLPEALDFRMH